jgi:hypothetical protein
VEAGRGPAVLNGSQDNPVNALFVFGRGSYLFLEPKVRSDVLAAPFIAPHRNDAKTQATVSAPAALVTVLDGTVARRLRLFVVFWRVARGAKSAPMSTPDFPKPLSLQNV